MLCVAYAICGIASQKLKLETGSAEVGKNLYCFYQYVNLLWVFMYSGLMMGWSKFGACFSSSVLKDKFSEDQ